MPDYKKGSRLTDRPEAHSRRSFISFVAFSVMGSLATTLGAGCKSMNEDPKNDRVWFPTLAPPSKEEQIARELNFPEGGDPFMDAESGPRSLNARPKSWDIQRSRTYYNSTD